MDRSPKLVMALEPENPNRILAVPNRQVARHTLLMNRYQCAWRGMPTVRVVFHHTHTFIGETMSRRIFAPILALAMSAGLVVAGTLPANATPVAPVAAVKAVTTAPTKVTINKIKTATVSKKTKTATVKPSVKSSGQVKVTSSKITVKQGKKTIAKTASSAKLKTGKYTVTTTAKYKTWTNKTTSKTVTTTKLVAKKGGNIAVTCKFKNSAPDVAPLGYFTGDPLDNRAVEILFVTTTCTGGFDGSFEVEGISAPATPGNIALNADGYYDWDPAFVPGGIPVAFVPESASETAKLNVLSPKDLYKTTKTVQKTTSKVWSKEQSKTLKQSLTVKK